MPKFVLLWTDAALFAMLAATLFYVWHILRTPTLRSTWRRVLTDAPACCAGVVLLAFVTIGLLDSVHYRPRLPPAPAVTAASGERASTPASGKSTAPAADSSSAGVSAANTPSTGAPVTYAPIVESLLDRLLRHTVLTSPEKNYSAPLASRQFTKETVLVNGRATREFPRLTSGGAHLANPDVGRAADVGRRLAAGLLCGVIPGLLAFLAIATGLRRRRSSYRAACGDLLANRSILPWRAIWLTTCALCLVVGALAGISTGYHALGTNSTGNDVLWQSLKSVRTALIIGSLTTVAMLPPAIVLGISAGYFKGRVDDVIQYVYTTLTSIPGVLLVAACVLMMQVYIDNNPALFDTSASRADLRLFLLCMILGLTGWSGLCRLLRAETLKLRELEYVQAARAFGVSHTRIMRRHILPNVMHIVLITMVLQFSSLVLYEAVLSYLGIGVDPTMNSFGSMIDASRLEMSRDPMIWWSLLAAFVFLLALVLAANLFADAVRDAFDPRTRRFRPLRKSSSSSPDQGSLS